MSGLRLRFAPSPTGSLHLGNARTAVFNHLLARHSGGTLVLRIDDTDRERHVEGAEAELIKSLRWLGIAWQEGPEQGGEFGPYRQSERGGLYDDAGARLLESGAAYRCFCTEERLAALREEAEKRGRPSRYDGHCRTLSHQESARRAEAGERFTLRFAAPALGVLRFDDEVKGSLSQTADGLGGDFIVVRADGSATYNLACVVDDAAMKIDIVLRGEDHLSNTFKQLLLYRALGLNPPRFAHAPMVLGPDRSKLSKRHGARSLEELRQDGYAPEAVMNMLALLGWSPKDGREAMSPAELEEAFSLAGMSRSPSVFEAEKLDWLSAKAWRARRDDAYLAEAQRFVPEPLRAALPADFALDHALLLIREGLHRLGDIETLLKEFLYQEPDEAVGALRAEAGTRTLVTALIAALKGMEKLDRAAWEALVKTLKTGTGLKGKALFLPLRAALSGRTHGPELNELVPLLGAREAEARARRFLCWLDEAPHA